jgi:hypothetical protein
MPKYVDSKTVLIYCPHPVGTFPKFLVYTRNNHKSKAGSSGAFWWTFFQCSGSVHWIRLRNRIRLFSSVAFKSANKKIVFFPKFCIFLQCVHLHQFFSSKKSQNGWNDVFLIFLLVGGKFRIQIRFRTGTYKKLQIRIRDAQKLQDPDPEPFFYIYFMTP